MFKKYSFHTAEKIFWIGALLLFLSAILAGFMWGFVAQMAFTIPLLFWGVFVRMFLSKA